MTSVGHFYLTTTPLIRREADHRLLMLMPRDPSNTALQTFRT
jgi:hypothetical protein